MRMTPLAWAFVVTMSAAYGTASFLLAMAWWHLLRHLGVSITRPLSVRIYGLSQLAKYVPGNIFHLAGRQALGMAQGLPAAPLARSMVWELGLLALAGAQFGWVILPLLAPALPGSASAMLWLGSGLLIVALLRGWAGRDVAWSFIWQLLFLLVSAAIFMALLAMTTGGGELSAAQWLTIGGAYIAAWLVGLVTPGAPAGVGVREMILLILLQGMVSESDLLMAVLLGRLTTVVGDVLFFIAAYAIARPWPATRKK